jgi:polar amino acid transport system substrate-binding protein
VVVGAIVAAGCGSSGGGGKPATASSSCTPAHQSLKTVASKQLTVTTDAYPPFTQTSGNKLGGLEGDILQAVAKKECKSLALKVLGFSSVIPAVQGGRADLAAGNWYCTAARSKIVSLAGPIYTDKSAVVSTTGATSLSQLEGQRVGSISGMLWVDELKKMYGSKLKLYPSNAAMYDDMSAGRIAGTLDSQGTAEYVKKQRKTNWTITTAPADPRVAATTKPSQVCFPVPKNNKALADAVTADVDQLRNDGTLARIFQKNGLDPKLAQVGPLNLI